MQQRHLVEKSNSCSPATPLALGRRDAVPQGRKLGLLRALDGVERWGLHHQHWLPLCFWSRASASSEASREKEVAIAGRGDSEEIEGR